MRKLTESEIELIQTSIRQKGLTAAELIAEIYDHYISHLENYPESEFESQLESLDEKWTYAYCHKLQSDLNKNLHKSILKMQWHLLKSYFSWPKMISTLLILLAISFSSRLMSNGWQMTLYIFIPTLFLFVLLITIIYRTNKKIKHLKVIFNLPHHKINSLFSSKFIAFLAMPFFLGNPLIQILRLFNIQDFFTPYLNNFLIVFCGFVLILHSLTFYEAWKVKSKTAFI